MVLPGLGSGGGLSGGGGGVTGAGGGPTDTGDTFTSLKLCETLTAVLPDFCVQSGMCVTVGLCGDGSSSRSSVNCCVPIPRISPGFKATTDVALIPLTRERCLR